MNTLVTLLPEQNPPPPVQGPEFGGSSPIGLVVTLLLLLALIFLIRSMNKHLKKVPPSFDPPEEKQRPAEDSVPGEQAAQSAESAPRSEASPDSSEPPRASPRS